MALSGLDIYKLLPKTNCRDCGFATCLAFAMQLAKKAVSIEKCPHISEAAKGALEAQSQPPIKLITVGSGENKLEIGNETVMFRHEEKFHHPCGLGFILEDKFNDSQLKQQLDKINSFKFERVGQKIEVNLAAVKQCGSAGRFAEAVKLVAENTSLGLVLMGSDAAAVKAALVSVKDRFPLLYHATKENLEGMAQLAKECGLPLVAYADNINELAELTVKLNNLGANDLMLETAEKSLSDKIWDLTQARRQALKKSNRALGYPSLAIAADEDFFKEAIKAATFLSKYAGIILVKGQETWEALSLLTLRQNIYTDPQKPLQIEPKLYPIGKVSGQSPVLVTTNFSLSYFTVLGEVEASKIPSYIMSVDTEGMSVLTAWAAEKFTPEKIAESLNKFEVSSVVAHKRLIIPGYVAVMSADLQDTSGWEIVVGPKEAAGIPSFLKNI